MAKAGLTFIVLFNLFQISFAQVGNDAVGARGNALGGYTTTLTDIWSANNNQAGLGFHQNISGGIYYENRFLLKETSYKSGAFVYPLKSGALGASVSSFGYQLYNQTQIGFSYGQHFGEKIAVGVQLNYLNTSLSENYGQKSAFTGAIGLIAKMTEELSMGVHIYNPTKAKLADFDNERIPTTMRLGLDYKFSEKVMVVIETEKDIDFSPVVKVGVEYHIIEVLYLRGGISTNPTLSSFGFGLKMKEFQLNVNASFHQTLGLTPGISLVYTRTK